MSGRFDASICRRVTEPCETMVGMEPIPATAHGRTRGASWGLTIGLLTGGGVMGLVWAFLTGADPDSDAAWLAPILGIPAALVIAAVVPVHHGRSIRTGMALGALLVLVVFIVYFVASVPYA